MLLKHVALVCSSQEKSDKFYADVLGLKKMTSKELPSRLAQQIFDFDSELNIINYANDDMHFEIFINEKKGIQNNRIEHVCLQVDDVEAFLQKCRAMEVEILQVPKAGAMITFIKDYDGNLFEMKGDTS